MSTLTAVAQSAGWFFVGYSVLLNTSFLLLTVLALYEFANYRRRVEFSAYDESFGDPLARGVSIVIPAFNEGATIVQAVQAMLALRYPDFEVVVVDDGSTDGTVELLTTTFDMVDVPLVLSRAIHSDSEILRTMVSRQGPMNLALVCKSNGGKADSLNVGINAAKKELVCMVDADSILDPDALMHVARPFADDPQRVLATGGVVRVANGSTIRDGRVVALGMPRGWLGRIQVVEYLRAFMIGRAGWSAAGGLLVISGAFGMFRRDVLFSLGGLATDCEGEDAELVVRLHRWIGDNALDGRVVFVSEPVAWTQAPEELRVLRRQRRRWHRGATEIFMRHWRMMLRPRYGVVGLVAMPWFLIFELLAPFFELLGAAYFLIVLVALGLHEVGVTQTSLVDPRLVLLLFSTSVVYAVFMSLVALLAEEVSYRRYRGSRDLLGAVWAAVEESFGYRQLNAWWCVTGTVAALRRSHRDWGDMERRGFNAP